MRTRYLLTALTALLFLQPAPAADPYDQSKVELEKGPPPGFKGKTVLLIAGSKSHGEGEHEFFAGTAILVDLLKQTPGVWPVMCRDGWPKDETLIDRADCLVLFMDGRGGHPLAKGDRAERVQKRMDAGAGWVNLHYAVDYAPKEGKKVIGWMGGYYDADISINPHWDADFRALPVHEITRGVKPFKIRDEWYYNMRFAEDMKGVTPILTALPPDSTRGTKDAKAHPGRPEVVAWAYERKDGGRGFGFTGGHFHRNWADENFRRSVVNAILWASKVEVPKEGAKVDFDAADLNKNLDRKGKGEFKPILPPKP